MKKATKHEEIIICDSCHYSTDTYNTDGLCDRCLSARKYWTGHEAGWRELFCEVALQLNCLPSVFLDGNDHVLRQAKQLYEQSCLGEKR